MVDKVQAFKDEAKARGIPDSEINRVLQERGYVEDTPTSTPEVTPEPVPEPTTEPVEQDSKIEEFKAKAKEQGISDEEVNQVLQERGYVSQPIATTKEPEQQTSPDNKAELFLQTAKDRGISEEEALRVLKERGYQDPRKAEDVGFIDRVVESFKEGFASFGDIKDGYDLALANNDKDRAMEMANIKAEAAAEAMSKVPTLTARDIQRIAEESGIISAGTKVPSFIVEQILKSGPQMAVPLLVAGAVGAVSGPAAVITAPLAGIITYGAQQFGNFMNTQGLMKDAPEDLEVTKALVSATVTAPIGFAMDRFVTGMGSMSYRQVAKEAAEELAKREVAKRTGKTIAKEAGLGGVKGFIAEAPTEVLETYAELYQAGADLNSEETKEAIFEAFWSAGAVGGGIKASLDAYQEYKGFKEDNLLSKQETDLENKNTEETVEETRNSQMKAILDSEERAQDTKEIKAKELGTVDDTTLKQLGIGKNTVAGKQLLDLDLTNPDNIEVAKNILNKENLKIKVNDTAVNSFRRKLNKQQKKLAQEAVDDKPKRRAPRTSTKVPKRPDVKPTPTVEESVGDGVVSPVADAGQPDDTTGKLDTPLEFQGKKVPKTLINQYNTYKQADATADTPAKKTAVQNRQKKLLTAVNNFLGKDSNPETQAELVRTLEGLGVQEAQPQTAKQKVIQKAQQKRRIDRQTDEEAISDLEAEQIRQSETDVDVDEKPATRPGKIGQRQIIQALKPFKTLGQVFNSLGTKFRDAMTEPQKILLSKLSGLQNINKTKFQVVEKLEQRKDAQTNEPTGNYGLYTPTMDTAQVSTSGDVETVLHEATHAATANQISKHVRNNKGVTALGRRIVSLFDTAKQADTNGQFQNELNTVDEFITEAFNNPAFQKFLASIPSPESTPSRIATLWSDFVQAVSDLLGLGDISGTVLNDVIAVAPDLFQGPNLQEQQQSQMRAMPQRRGRKNVSEKEVKKQLNEASTPREKEFKAGKDPDEKFVNKTPVSIPSKIATSIFSFDTALNKALKKAMILRTKLDKDFNWNNIKKILTETSLSQALHAEQVAQQFLKFGKIIYNNIAGKFEVVNDPNAPSFEKVMESVRGLAKASGLSLKTMREVATKAFTARRARQISDNNATLEVQARNLVRQGKRQQAEKLLNDNYVLVGMSEELINKRLAFFDQYPELEAIFDMWTETKNNTVQFMVDNEMMSQDQADQFMNAVDEEGNPNDTYIPFTREGLTASIEKNTRGIGDSTKFYKMKGSYRPVKDVFTSMETWLSKSIEKAVQNRVALNKIRATEEFLPNDIKKGGTGPNSIVVSELNKSGNRVIQSYEFSDPYYASAIGGIENNMIQGIQFFTSISNFLRSNVVLYPLFSIAQLPQDSVSAMFSAGVRNPFMIPLRVLKEFPLTLLDMSKTHSDLQKFGAVGGFGSYLQGDTEADRNINKASAYNTFRKALGVIPGLTQASAIRVGDKNLSVSGLLNRIAMASDNAVRQAVYEQTMSETGDTQLAIERAFEVINFRRAGSSATVTTLRQVVPFFGAALQALSVQGRVLTAQGITPQTKVEAAQKLATSFATLTGVTLLYNALMEGDEEFEKMDPKMRDRRILFGNGLHLTLRPDLFTYLGKIMPEHVLQNMVYESEDNMKTWEALSSSLKDVFAMSVVPQAVRPIQELFYNYSASMGRSITPQSLEGLDITQQRTPNTTLTAQYLGEMAGINPTKVDYFLRQYFGYTIGIFTTVLDSYINDKQIFPYDLATKSDRDRAASIPGMSAFISRNYDNRLTSDYYAVKADAEAAVKAYNALSEEGFDVARTREFANLNKELIKYKKDLSVIEKDIRRIKKDKRITLKLPRNKITPDERQKRLERLNKQEASALRNIRQIRKNIYGIKQPFKYATESSIKRPKPPSQR